MCMLVRRASSPCWSVLRLRGRSLCCATVPHRRAPPALTRHFSPTCCRSVAATPLLSVIQVRAYGTSQGATEEEEEDEEDDFMQAYEDMLLNASSQREPSASDRVVDTPNEDALAKASHVSFADTSSATTFPPPSSSATSTAEALVAEAAALLPADGTAMALTDLTPLLDAEAISEHFGSVRGFLQLYPHRFTCVLDAHTKRWRVSRAVHVSALSAAAAGGAAAPSSSHSLQESASDAVKHAALDMAEMTLKEELAEVLRGANASSSSSSSARIANTTTTTITTQDEISAHTGKEKPARPAASHRLLSLSSAQAAVPIPWPAIADLLPEDGSCVPIALLRSQLPPEIAQALRANRAGLARCFKQDYDTARAFVALTADATAFMRVAATAVVVVDPRVDSPSSSSSSSSTMLRSSTAPTRVPLWTPQATGETVTHHLRSAQTGTAAAATLDDGVYVPAPADYTSAHPEEEAEAWWVDVPLDEEEGEGDAGAAAAAGKVGGALREGQATGDPRDDDTAGALPHTAAVDDANVLDAATGLQEVPYDGPDCSRGREGSGATFGDASLLAGLDIALLRHAPAAPCAAAAQTLKLPDSLAAASSSSAASSALTAVDGAVKRTTKKARVPRPSTPDEWIALHTALANAHGWLTPPEMLDYLVECVPTFFVPLNEVRISDALLKLVGPRTSMRTLLTRIYVYYVDRSEDGERVRLAAHVTHPQRAMADRHYPAWNPAAIESCVPATAGGDWHGGSSAIDDGDDSGNGNGGGGGGESLSACARLSSSKLQTSETTKMFPVMHVRRPIKSALPGKPPRKRRPGELPCASSPLALKQASVSAEAVGTPTAAAVAAASSSTTDAAAQVPSAAGDGKTASTTTRPLAVVVLPRRSQAGGVSLSSIPVTDIGYPFLALATQPVEVWPWWARLLCLLPCDAYVPLKEIGTCYVPGLTPDEVASVWKASESLRTDSSAGSKRDGHPFPFTLLRPPPEGPRLVRLRPFWLSPGCTAELDASVMPADLARQLRPVWMPVSRVMAKLTASSREATLSLARRRMPGVTCTPEAALLCLLRDCGRCCWVNEEGTKVRRYAAAHEMDDVFHLSLSLLHGFSSAQSWEPVPVVLARAAAHVQPLFSQATKSSTGSPYDVGLIGMLHRTPMQELQPFLKRHVQWIDVKPSTAEGNGEAASELLIRRRAAFVSFTHTRA